LGPEGVSKSMSLRLHDNLLRSASGTEIIAQRAKQVVV